MPLRRKQRLDTQKSHNGILDYSTTVLWYLARHLFHMPSLGMHRLYQAGASRMGVFTCNATHTVFRGGVHRVKKIPLPMTMPLSPSPPSSELCHPDDSPVEPEKTESPRRFGDT